MEAGLYRYGDAGEAPVDEHNHALSALRYLISRLDARKMARLRTGATQGEEGRRPQRDPWPRVDNEAV
jgi:hypothetical protein